MAIDADQPVFDIKTMDDVITETFSQRRVTGVLLGIFAGVSLVLAALGVYAVLAYSVTQRTREIGIRLALGAGRASVVKMLVWRAMRLALAGIATGLAGGLIMIPVLASIFPGIATGGIATFFEVSVFLAVVALAASYAPVRRAVKVNPATALRCE
jgi:putative ABC transport system permease protein